jgi:hypothetical protein
MAIDRQYRLESHAKARVIFLASHAFVRLIASSYQKLSKLSEDIAETLEVIPMSGNICVPTTSQCLT